MTVQEVCRAIEEWAPPALAYEWDRAGLCVGDPAAEAGRVMVTLSVTREAFRAAKKARTQLIIAHHPLVWDPLKVLRTDDPHTRLCLDIAASGIACYAAHTNLDVAPGGVNALLAERLGLQEVRPLLPVGQARYVKLVTFVPESHLEAVRNAVCAAGAGVIGAYTHCSFSSPGVGTFLPGEKAQPYSGQKFKVNEEPERRFEVLVPEAIEGRVIAALRSAHPYEEPAYDVVCLKNRDPGVGLGVRGRLVRPQTLDSFARFVCKALELPSARMVGDKRRRVREVAVLGGAGGGQIAGIPGEVDVYVTGDVSYTHAIGALERNLCVVDAGHHGTEKWIVPAMAAFLRQRFEHLRVTIYHEPEPFRVVVST